MLFPYKNVRKEQDKLIKLVEDVINRNSNLIAHAPTGLGKTVATLAPALDYAIRNDMSILFLTSRHTQHLIALETLKLIKEKFKQDIVVTSMVGKKWLCVQPGVATLRSSEFNEYCRKVREDNKCNFYLNTKKGDLTLKAKLLVEQLEKLSPLSSENVVEYAKDKKLCPYEISIALAKRSKVIIADYYYVFHPNISNRFLNKINKSLNEFIVIIDEGHNLPARIRDLMTAKMSNIILERAIKEAQKMRFEESAEILKNIKEIIISMAEDVENEKYVKKEDFLNKMKILDIDYEQLIADLEFVADEIREIQKQSAIGFVAAFLEQWLGPDDGFVRIISKDEKRVVLSYRCLDPSLATKHVIDQAHSVIMMSGTLMPTDMYKELLGFEEAELAEFDNPFPKKNRLNLIVPKTTTKFTMRNEQQFKDIAKVCSDIVNNINGNCAIFFPSYYLLNAVNKFFVNLCEKTTFEEHQKMTKQDKISMLDGFKEYQDTGAVLLAVIGGNFSEGIDLPGDLLKAVIVVGLPLQRPDLETKKLIEYYDKKFGKGWDYGYVFPAFSKALQSAGRCIRSSEDKGAIVFLDERYAWPNYVRCFPDDIDLKISKNYLRKITDFFKGEQKDLGEFVHVKRND